MKTFKSKIDLALVLFLVVMLGSTTLLMIFLKAWPGLLIMLATAGFIIHLFRTTYYQIEAGQLRIKSGFIYNKVIPIATIRSIKKSGNILSSPALSFDRIEIKYGQQGWILISPIDQVTFVAELQKVNPHMEVTI